MTKNSFCKFLAALAGFALAAAPALADEKKLSVLIIDGQNNHNWASTTPILKDALESCGKFTVEVSTSPSNAQGDWEKWRPDFTRYDAVLTNYNGQDWPQDVRDGLLKYVSDGGAFVVVHAANNAFGNWKEYNQMIGLGGWGGRNEKSGPYLYVKDGKLFRDTSPGGGGSHGAQHEFNVDTFPEQAGHPIMKGLPKSWKHAKDELYDSLRGPAENVTVLASAYSEKSKKHEPMIMTIDYGKGRVFHTPMGHADYSMRDVGFYTVLQRGTEWAITGKVTIPVPDNFPTADKVVPVAE